MFTRKLVATVFVVLLFLCSTAVAKAEQTVSYTVSRGDTATWVARKVTGNDTAYLKATLIRGGVIQRITKASQWNKIWPDDVIRFDSADGDLANPVEVGPQSLSQFCKQFSTEKCPAELAFRNRI